MSHGHKQLYDELDDSLDQTNLHIDPNFVRKDPQLAYLSDPYQAYRVQQFINPNTSLPPSINPRFAEFNNPKSLDLLGGRKSRKSRKSKKSRKLKKSKKSKKSK